jgi:hypothetical protein
MKLALKHAFSSGWFCVGMILAVLPARSQSTWELDTKNSFRGAVFGDSISSYHTMRLVEDDGNNKYYERTDEDLSLGSAQVKRIVYGFYKGQLFSVNVKTIGLVNSRAVLKILQSLYGDGEQSNPYIEDYDWLGNKVDLNYKENSITGDASIWYNSVPIQKQVDADQARETKNGSSKF